MTESKNKRLSSIKNIAVTITTGAMSTGLFWGLVSCGEAVSDPDSLLNLAIDRLGSNEIKEIFDFDYTKKASDEVNAKPKDFFLNKIKTSAVFEAIDSDILANFSVNDLDLIFDDTKGLLLLTIINHGPVLKMISIDGFATEQNYEDIETIFVNIESDDLADDLEFDYDSKPNQVLQSFDKNDFVSKIKELDDSGSDILSNLSGDDVSLSVNDETGVLTATVTFGDIVKTFDFAGFLNADEEFISSALDSITESDLDAMFLKNDLPSRILAEMDVNELVTKIKNLPDVNILGDQLLQEITSDNIQLDYNDTIGLVEVTIIGFGPEKLFGVPDFLTTAQNEEILDFLQNLDIAGDEISDALSLDFSLKATDASNQKTTEDFLEGVKFSNQFNQLSIPAQSFLTADDLNIDYSDNAGVINLQISHQDENYSLPLGPFKTSASADLESALATISQRDLSNLINFNTEKLASAPENDKTELFISGIIRNLPQIKDLANASEILPEDIGIEKDDVNGEIIISISNHGPKLTYRFIGFIKSSDVDKYQEAILKMESSEEFAAELGFDKTQTPTSDKNQISLPELAFRLRESSYFRNLVLKDALTEDNLKIAFDDDNGAIIFRISSMNADNEIIFKGFLTNEQDELNAAIQSLSENVLLPLIPFNTNSLPTDEVNRIPTDKIVEIIKSSDAFKDLAGVELLSSEDLFLDANNETGEIELVIKNHGTVKIIVFHDFLKKGNLLLNDFVQNLDFQYMEDELNFDYDNLPSATRNSLTKENVLEVIKKNPEFIALPENAQNEFLLNDISIITDDEIGKISIVIKHHGEAKLLEFVGFGTNDDLNALNAAIENLEPSNSLSNFLGLDKNILPSKNFESISEEKLLNNLKNSESIINLKLKNYLNEENVNWKYDDISGKFYLIITVNNQYKEIEFDDFITKDEAVLNENIQSLKSTDIENALFFSKNVLPSSSVNMRTEEKVLDILKNSDSLKDLNGIDFLKLEDISLDFDNNSGQITISIDNHGVTKKLLYEGFITQADENLNNFIHSLRSADLASQLNFDTTLKPSDSFNIKSNEDVFDIIKNLPGFLALETNAQSAFFATDIWLDYNDADGQISIIIKHHGSPQVLNYLGFVSNENEEEMRVALENTIVDDEFETVFDFNKSLVPTSEQNFKNKDEILKDFLALPTLKDLRLADELTIDDIEVGADDQNGVVIMKIHYSGETYEFSVSGFVTPEEYELNEEIANLEPQNFTDFLNFDTSALPSNDINNVDKNELANFIKNLDSFKNLSKVGEFSDSNIEVYYNDDVGEVEISIKTYGVEKKLLFSNFIDTTNSELKTFIQNIDLETLSDLLDVEKNKKASDISNQLDKQKVLDAIGDLEDFASLSEETKTYLASINLVLSTDDTKGVITVKMHNSKVVLNLNIDGFVTNDDEKKLNDLIQNLTPELAEENLNLNKYFSVENYRNEFTLEEYLTSVIESPIFKDLKAKNLLLVSDLSLSKDNSGGTFFITISNHGKNKVISHSGFANENTSLLNEQIFNIKTDELISLMNLSFDKLPSDDENNRTPADVVEAISKIPEFAELAAINELLAEDITVSTNDEDGKMVITIKNHGDLKTLEFDNFTDINNNFLNEAISEITIDQLKENIELDFSMKSSEFLEVITTEMIVEAFNKETAINSLSNEQRANLISENFALEADDTSGTLKLNFKNNYYQKTWSFDGFVSEQDEMDFENAIANLEVSEELKNHFGFDLELLPSNENNSLSSELIRTKILELDQFENLKLKTNLKASDISITANNDTGIIIMVIKNGDLSKELSFSGFITASEKNLNDVVSAISAEDLEKIVAFSKQELPDSDVNQFSLEEFLVFIKDLPEIKDLENKDELRATDLQVIYENSVGEVQLKITNHGNEKLIVFKNFLNSDEKALNDALQEIDDLVFENTLSLNKDQLPSLVAESMSKQYLLDKIKSLPEISDLKNKGNLVLENFFISTDDEKGLLTILVSNHGPDKTFAFSGFINNDQSATKNYLLEMNVENLKNDLELILDKKASDESNSKSIDDILQAIENNNKDFVITDEMRSLISDNFTVNHNDETGVLSLVFAIHGDPVTIAFNGFVTIKEETEFENAIQSLDSNSELREAMGLDSNKLPSENNLEKNFLLENIKNFPVLSNLRANYQLDISDLEVIANNKTGIIEIRIMNFGEPKLLQFSNFLTDSEKELNIQIQKLTADDIESALGFDKDFLASDTVNEKSGQDVLMIIQKLERFANLEGLDKLMASDFEILANDDNGQLKINISNHGDQKSLKIISFLTTNEKSLNETINLLTVDDFLAQLNLDFNSKASAEINLKNPEDILEILRDVDSFEQLPNEVKNIVIPSDFSLNYNDDQGEFAISINGHGNSKNLVYKGFVTNQDEKDLEEAIKNLEANDDLADHFGMNKSALPGNGQNYQSIDSFVNSLVAWDSITPLRLKNLIVEEDLSVKVDNELGTLELLIKNHGPDKKLLFKDFLTSNESELNMAIQNLDSEVLDEELQLEKSKLPSDDANIFNASELINIIKRLPSFKDLTLLDNLVESGLSIETNDNEGNVKVIISNHGNLKEITFNNFITFSDNEINQFILKIEESKLSPILNFDQNEKASNSINYKENQTILDAIQSLAEYKELSDSAKKRLVVEDLNFLAEDDFGQITIEINNHGASKKLVYSGFVTNNDEIALEKAIQNLEITEEMIDGFNFDFSKLPSDQENLTGEFLTSVFQNLNEIKGLKLKNRIQETSLKINTNDDEGILKIIITGFGNDKTVLFDEFLSTSEKELQTSVQNLSVSVLEGKLGFNSGELASSANNKKTNQEVLDVIKGLSEFQDLAAINNLLTSDFMIDYNDEVGEITVSIINHGETKTLLFTGFVTEHDDELNTFVEELSKDDLSENLTFNFDKLPSNSENALTNTDVLEAIQSLYKFSQLSDNAQNIFGENDISVAVVDDSGQIKISIKHYGNENNIIYDGFVSTNDFDDLNEAVANLASSTVLSDYFGFDKEKLPSDQSNTLSAEMIVNKIKETDSFSSLRLKDNLVSENLKITPDDAEGIITIVISNYGETRSLVFDNFINSDKKALNDAVQSLSLESFENVLNFQKDKLPSESNNHHSNSEVLDKLVNLPSFQDLNYNDLLTEEDINFVTNDESGKIIVIVMNHGPTRTFEFNGFITSSDVEFRGFIKSIEQSDLENILNFDNSELPSDEINKRSLDDLLKAIHTLPEFSELSDEAQFLLAETEVEMMANDNNGTIEINVSSELISRKFRFGGFLNKEDFNQLVKAVSELKISDLDSLEFKKSELPSSDNNYRDNETVLNTIKSLPAFVNLRALDKFTSEHLGIDYDDDAGNVVINIKGYGKSKTLTIDGFATIHNESLTNFLKSLASDDLESQLKFDYSLKASSNSNQSKAKWILKGIQSLPNFQSLTKEARDLLRYNDFEINSNDEIGTITFRIKNHGEIPNIEISGFVSDNDEKLLNEAIENLNSDTDLGKRLGFDFDKTVDDEVNKKSTSEIAKQFQNLDEFKDLRLKEKLAANNFKIKRYTDDGKIVILITGHGHEKLLTFEGFSKVVSVNENYKNYLNEGNFSATTSGIQFTNYAKVPEIDLQFQKGFIFEASDKRIFLSDDKTIYQWTSDGLNAVDTKVNPENGFMYENENGELYLGASSGLYKLIENELELISKVSMVNGFIYKTSQNRTYVGTSGEGLMELQNDKLVSVNENFSMYDSAMIETSTGRLLIISRGSNLLELEGNSLRYVNRYWFGFNESFIYETSDGVIYFGGSKGLMILKDDSVYRISNLNLTKSGMYETSDNRIFISAANHGLLELKGNKLEVVDKEKPKNGFIYETSDGAVYYPGSSGLKSFSRQLPSFAKYVYSVDDGKTWEDKITGSLKKGQKILVNIVNKDSKQTIKWKDGFSSPITLVVN